MRWHGIVAGATILLLSACGGSSSQENVAPAHPPSVSNVTYTPSVVYEGSYEGTAAVSVSANYSDAGGDPGHVALTLRDGDGRILQSQRSPVIGQAGATSGTIWGQMMIPTAKAGEYTVDVGVLDCCAAMSNVLCCGFRVAPFPYGTRPIMPTPRQRSATAAAGGLVYVLGGADTLGSASASVEAYDPSTRTWATRASMTFPRDNPVAGVIGGKIYVVGGRPSAESEVYDPVTNAWSTIAPMPTARVDAAGCVVGGKLYVLGGYREVELSTVEVYDPAANSWTTAAPMPTPRSYAAAAPLGDKIYVVGGHQGVLNPWMTTVEVMDIGTATWTVGPSLPVGLSQHAALPLAGQVVVFGGGQVMPRVSVYRLDPATGQWTLGAPLPRIMATPSAAVSGKGYLFDGCGTYEYDPTLDLGPLD